MSKAKGRISLSQQEKKRIAQIGQFLRAEPQGVHWAPIKILFDYVLWVVLAKAALTINEPWATVFGIIIIGVFPLHDILVHGHDSTHGLVARNSYLNRFFLFLNHAVVGLSGNSYRTFHLDHHRYTHTEKDPEYRLIHLISKGKGWGYLLIPYAGLIFVNFYPFISRARAEVKKRTIIEFTLIILLHAGLLLVLTPKVYGLFVLLPIVTSLSLVVSMRSLCEHHYKEPTSRTTNTRSIECSRVLEWLWSNTNYHLEHHLFPYVPYDKLPLAREQILRDLPAIEGQIEKGYLKTALHLLSQENHIREAREKPVR